MKAKITSRLDDVNRRIAAQATAAGRDPKNVRLIAVSKTIDCDRIREAYDAGQRRFGENRIQELVEKAAVLPSDIEWHVVGHVQRNKVRPAVQHSYLIHSVDSLQMLQRIDSIAGELGKVQNILLQANFIGEATKSGLSETALEELAVAVGDCRNVAFLGFMTMAPFGVTTETLAEVFGGLRDFRDHLAATHDLPLSELSMGMSDDYQHGIAHGATLVRIGTAIFGKRL
jgi:pyridoxal phosphate enzyme (YggS family)